MLIKDWMSKTPITAKPATSIMKAAKLMKENGFKRLPVVDDDGRLVGIVSDRDIKEASPSKARCAMACRIAGRWAPPRSQARSIITGSPCRTVNRSPLKTPPGSFALFTIPLLFNMFRSRRLKQRQNKNGPLSPNWRILGVVLFPLCKLL